MRYTDIQLAPRKSFVDTRYRSNDIDTSRDAAKNAASQAASERRIAIRKCLADGGPMTAKEIASVTGLNYIEVQRRISETGGIERTADRRDGCAVWRCVL